MSDEFGRSDNEKARDALLLMISIEEGNGNLSTEIATISRDCVDMLYRAAQQQQQASALPGRGMGSEAFSD